MVVTAIKHQIKVMSIATQSSTTSDESLNFLLVDTQSEGSSMR